MVTYIWWEDALIYDFAHDPLGIFNGVALGFYNSLLASRVILVSQIWQRPEAEF